MSPEAIQRAIDARTHTLCTYEHPAALHEVLGWEQSMRDAGRMLGNPLRLKAPLLAVRYHLECEEADEMLYAIGIPSGTDSQLLRNTLSELTLSLPFKLPRPWTKCLHFGKIPVDDNLNVLVAHWMGVVQRPSPCGHPVCRATHACIAPSAGSA